MAHVCPLFSYTVCSGCKAWGEGPCGPHSVLSTPPEVVVARTQGMHRFQNASRTPGQSSFSFSTKKKKTYTDSTALSHNALTTSLGHKRLGQTVGGERIDHCRPLLLSHFTAEICIRKYSTKVVSIGHVRFPQKHERHTDAKDWACQGKYPAY